MHNNRIHSNIQMSIIRGRSVQPEILIASRESEVFVSRCHGDKRHASFGAKAAKLLTGLPRTKILPELRRN